MDSESKLLNTLIANQKGKIENSDTTFIKVDKGCVDMGREDDMWCLLLNSVALLPQNDIQTRIKTKIRKKCESVESSMSCH